jgi:hypothetical protein
MSIKNVLSEQQNFQCKDKSFCIIVPKISDSYNVFNINYFVFTKCGNDIKDIYEYYLRGKIRSLNINNLFQDTPSFTEIREEDIEHYSFNDCMICKKSVVEALLLKEKLLKNVFNEHEKNIKVMLNALEMSREKSLIENKKQLILDNAGFLI